MPVAIKSGKRKVAAFRRGCDHRLRAALKKIQVTDAELAAVNLTRDEFHPEWNYSVNRRRSRHRGLLFYRLLEGALAAQPAPYKTLISPRALPAGDSPANPG